MNESQTRLLIQRELDGNLSQEEETRLRRVLMVSDSAVSFRANLSQVVAVAKDLELPDDVRPGDSSQLAVEIIENLPVVKEISGIHCLIFLPDVNLQKQICAAQEASAAVHQTAQPLQSSRACIKVHPQIKRR